MTILALRLTAAMHITLLILLACPIGKAWAYPLINNIDIRDKAYLSLVEAVEAFNKNPNNTLELFEYKLKKEETLLSVSKLAKISISALISINRSNSIAKNSANEYILIPAVQGIFLPVHPTNDLEFLLYKRLRTILTKELPITIKGKYAYKSNTFYFLPKQVLSKLEYGSWLNTDFRVPVLEGYITSYFGYRKSPISGNMLFHNGIDIAASSGDQIFASASGTVLKDGYNAIFGYYIVISHSNNYKTLYGHMLDATVGIGDTVYAGEQIGFMGSTGASTGHHIHFEILRNDKAIDPLPLLNLE